MIISLCRFLVHVLPTPMAVWLIHALSGKASRLEVTQQQQAALDAAERASYGRDGSKAAWCWGSGPVVLFVHGWSGRAAQLAPLAQQIAWEGYRCICIDVTAHGESPGERASWRAFLDDLADAATHFGPIHACVGHSAGGLAMLAARAQDRMAAESYVCVCAPSHPFPPIRAIRDLLSPPIRVLAACQTRIAEQFATTWRLLEAGRPWRSAVEPMLLFYDRKDRFIDHTEADRIHAWVPHARVIKSSGHGHARVLASDELAHAIVEFLAEQSGRRAVGF